MQTAVGFIGLGVTGTPMALNLARAGSPLVVQGRSNSSDGALEAGWFDLAELDRDDLLMSTGGQDVARRAVERTSEPRQIKP